MAVRRRGRFSLREDRRLIQMAAESVTLEEAAAAFGTSVATIELVARRLGLPLRGRDHAKHLSAGAADGVSRLSLGYHQGRHRTVDTGLAGIFHGMRRDRQSRSR